jgi:RHS repeat-associated protein
MNTQHMKSLSLMLLLLALLAPSANAIPNFCTVPLAPGATPPPASPPSVCNLSCPSCTNSPCYFASGVFGDSYTDLSIVTVGFPLTISRRYESARVVDGPVGIGWTSSLTSRLFVVPYIGAVEFVSPEGTVWAFSDAGGGHYTPPQGHKDQLVRNGDGSFDLTLQFSRSTYHFDPSGLLLSMADDFGNTLAIAHDANGRVSQVADQAGSGRYLNITWGPAGRITSVTDSASRTVSYGYGADGTLTSVTNPLNQSTAVAYVAGRLGPVLESIRDPWGRIVTQLTWESATGRLHSYTEGDPAQGGETYTYAYHPEASPPYTQKIDSLGVKTLQYTTGGALVTNDLTTYDSEGRPLTRQNRDNSTVTYYTYNAAGQVGTVTTGGVTWTYTYDTTYPEKTASVVSSSSDWPSIYYTYVPTGSTNAPAIWFIKQKRSDSATQDTVRVFNYNPKGQVTTAADATGVAQYFTYNAAGDTTSSFVSGSTTYTRDSLGRALSSATPSGSQTLYTYDALDRVTAETMPKPAVGSALNFLTTNSYDEYDAPTGLVLSRTTDPNGIVTKNYTDSLGHLVRHVDGAGNATNYQWSHNLLVSITDANGNVTSYSYDSSRHLAQTTFPNGGVETYTYVADTLTSKTDRNGITTWYNFDAWGRLTRRTFMNGSVTLGNIGIGYIGQKLVGFSRSFTPENDNIYYTYDNAYRILTETQNDRSVITYEYQPTGASPLVKSYTIAPTQTSDYFPRVDYTYDNAGRVSTMHWSLIPSGDFSFAYNANGQYQSISFPNGQSRTFSYDNQSRLTQVTNDVSSGSVATFTYGYDFNWATSQSTMLGQRTSVNVSATADAQQRIGLTKYFYDSNYQLVRTDTPQGAGWVTQSWTYDPIGNRTVAVGPGGPTPFTYFLNATGGNSQRLQSAGGVNFSYDGNGNATSWGSFDVENHFVGSPGARHYDGLGRRVSVVKSGQTTVYAYRGLDMIQERNLNLNAWNDYLFAPGIDEPLANFTPGTGLNVASYFATDGLGSVVVRNDPTGAVLGWAQYDSWGESVSVGRIFGFTGREMPDGYGVDFRARQYLPSIGRFLSEDPLQLGGGDINLYRYGLNRPSLLVDPLGLSSCVGGEELNQYCAVGPYYALLARDLKFDAYEAADGSGLPDPHNGLQDAFRHCYWSCRMAQAMGAAIAQTIGDIHERCGGGPANENAMDQFNNAIGRSLGRPGINCSGTCMAMVKAGRTRNHL